MKNTFYQGELNKKIIRKLSLIVIVTVILIVYITTSSLVDLENRKLEDTNGILLETFANESEILLRSCNKVASILSKQIGAFDEIDFNKVSNLIEPASEVYSSYKSIYVISYADEFLENRWSNGEIEIMAIPKNSYGRHLYELNNKEYKLIEPMINDVYGEDEIITTILAPIKRNDVIVGMVGIDLTKDYFKSLTKHMELKKDIDIDIMVISSNGYIIANTSDFALRNIENFDSEHPEKSIRNVITNSERYYINSQLFNVGLTDGHWYLTILQKDTALKDEIIQTSFYIVFTGAICLFLIILFNGKTVNKALYPIRDILTTLDNATDGDLSTRVTISSNDEIESIAIGLNKLLISLENNTLDLQHEIALNTDLNSELEDLINQNDRIYFDTIRSLVKTVEAKDEYTAGHCDRVTNLAILIGQSLAFSPKDLTDLTYGAILHDIGKIAISDKILLKNTKLTSEEYQVIKNHPQKGIDIISGVHFLESAQNIIIQHHERYDGKGYPNGLIGEDISLSARIVSITDAYDAMTSSRSYRNALDKDTAIAQLKEGSGTQFDPELLKVFLKILDKNPNI